ncbi:MAG TPA: hypothetical protein VFA11_18520 [Acidimicrobiales bacterium]|nr:hypothetical protein [Acidimicrobiales bacterium]
MFSSSSVSQTRHGGAQALKWRAVKEQIWVFIKRKLDQHMATEAAEDLADQEMALAG